MKASQLFLQFILAWLLIFSLVSTTAYSQLEITGYVYDSATQEPLAGTNIYVKGTVVGTITNEEGFFRLKLKRRGVLWFSLIGYSHQSVMVRKDTAVKIYLNEEIVNLPERSKPNDTIKSEAGTTYIYSIDTLSIDNEFSGRTVSWNFMDYTVIVPYETFLWFLDDAKSLKNEDSYARKFLKKHADQDKIHLTGEVIKRLGEWNLRNFALRRVNSQSIQLVDSKKNRVKFLIREDSEWFGNCFNCCWGGLTYYVPGDNRTLFSVTSLIC